MAVRQRVARPPSAQDNWPDAIFAPDSAVELAHHSSSYLRTTRSLALLLELAAAVALESPSELPSESPSELLLELLAVAVALALPRRRLECLALLRT